MELPLSARVRQGGAPLARAAALCAAAGLVVLATLVAAQPAAAQPAVWVTVSPSTVTVGLQVGISGSCGENVGAGTASSGAFPSPVALTPMNGLLSATATVPETTPAKGYTVTIFCPAGNSTSTTLWVVSNATPSQGPATGGGGSSHQGGGTALVAGIAVLAAGAVVGLVARRRRRQPIRL